MPSIWMEPKENLSKRMGTSPHVHALFFDVMTVKANPRCSTSLLPQCGQATSPSSYSAGDRVFENSCLHAWQKYSSRGMVASVWKGGQQNCRPRQRLIQTEGDQSGRGDRIFVPRELA